MQLIYGTNNPSKLLSMQQRLDGLEIDLIGLNSMDYKLTEPEETGELPVDNARIKAMSYYKQLRRPVLSADIGGKTVTCKASEVYYHREGICYAKSHLLAAILRANGIPCGFCYQWLILNDETAPYLIIHGLNAVYIEELDRWIRVDARGNKEGVSAELSLDYEKLAFVVMQELGEEDILIVFPEPDKNIVECLCSYDNVEELFENLPVSLAHR